MKKFNEYNDIFEEVLNTDIEDVILSEDFLKENADRIDEDIDPRALAIVSEYVDFETLTWKGSNRKLTENDLTVLMLNAHCSPIGEEIVSYVDEVDLEKK